MPLTNQQYDSIIRTYEEKQNRNHRLLDMRRSKLYESCPKYRELEERSATVSVSCARQLLDGNEEAAALLKKELSELSSEKTRLLTAAGYPEHYLEESYECPDCHDTGYIGNEKCHCFKQQMITLLYEQSNIRSLLDTENFNTLSEEYYSGDDLLRFRQALKTCHEFIDNFHVSYQNLFFYGTVGTGKSFLSSCIARELLDSGSCVIYFSSAALFERLSQIAFDYHSKEDLSHFYDDIYNCDLVIIDDLGTELTNAFVSSQLFSLLNERHLRKKPTLISTNLSLEDLRDRYSDRIFSRITSNYKLCKLTGPDIRMYIKRKQNRK